MSPTPTRDSHLVRLAGGEWSPYFGEKLDHRGCDAWLITEAFALKGYRVEYGFFPWARSYSLASDGSWDGTPEWADTPDHRKLFYLSDAYISNQKWMFMYRKDKPFDWKMLDDLQGKVIGLTSGYVYSDAFLQLRTDPKTVFEEAASDEANIHKLLAGRIDVFPVEEQVGKSILRDSFTQEERDQLAFHPTSFQDFKPYLLLSKAIPGNKELMDQFNAGWNELVQSGKYDQIMRDCLNK
jgi:polar amino acid transport system substrate-binding protein